MQYCIFLIQHTTHAIGNIVFTGMIKARSVHVKNTPMIYCIYCVQRQTQTYNVHSNEGEQDGNGDGCGDS